MLQAIREKFSGWILIIIMLLLVVPFALFGINNYFQTQIETFVAKVNDTEITPQQFQERIDLQRRQMRQMLGQDADISFVDTIDNKRRVLDSLIDEELRYQDARAAGVEVPEAKLRSEILAIDAFKPSGTFDQDTYVAVLRNMSMTPAMFQQRMVRDMASREIVSRLAGSAIVTDAEVDAYLRLQNQTRSFTSVQLRSADETVPVPTEDEIAKDYEARKDELKTPEMVILDYVELKMAEISVAALSEEDLKARYDEMKDRYVVPEQRLASHVLVEVAGGADAEAQKAALAKAESLLAEIRGGKDFAEVAKASSDDIGSKEQGGDLGWIESGANDPAFDEALFQLEVGKVSEPVLGANGYHLIQLREIRAGSQRPFDEVKGEIEAEYRTSEQERLFSEKAGELVDAIHADPQSLQGPADKVQLEVKRTAPFARTGGADIAANPEVVQQAFSELVLDRGQTSDLIDLSKDHVVAIRVAERKAPEPRTLDQVRGEIAATLTQKAQRAQLEAKAKALEARLAGGETLDAIAKELGKTPNVADAVVRTAGNQDGRILEQVFKMPRPAGTPVRKALRLGDDEQALVELTAVVDGDPKAAEQAARDAARSQLVAQWTEAETGAYVKALRQQAEIKIAEDRL
ncbi:MAG: SurA N-terminal domain-containing protein [Rhodanobacteraceae bacterium]|nr:SurA N-terminal domain-containing protein [Rhodanobacteraceae bacterium]